MMRATTAAPIHHDGMSYWLYTSLLRLAHCFDEELPDRVKPKQALVFAQESGVLHGRDGYGG